MITMNNKSQHWIDQKSNRQWLRRMMGTHLTSQGSSSHNVPRCAKYDSAMPGLRDEVAHELLVPKFNALRPRNTWKMTGRDDIQMIHPEAWKGAVTQEEKPWTKHTSNLFREETFYLDLLRHTCNFDLVTLCLTMLRTWQLKAVAAREAPWNDRTWFVMMLMILAIK